VGRAAEVARGRGRLRLRAGMVTKLPGVGLVIKRDSVRRMETRRNEDRMEPTEILDEDRTIEIRCLIRQKKNKATLI